MATIAAMAWIAFALGPIAVWAAFRSPGYKRRIMDAVPPGGSWQDTGERFRDIRDEAVVAVWYDVDTGERVYVRSE